MSLERYREVIPEWERFREVAATPEPTTFRVRVPRIEPAAAVRSLESQGFRIDPVPGPPDVFRVSGAPYPLGQTLEHWHGLLYAKQAVMALPPLALDVRSGHRVLDLCAAPGGKTTHLADLAGDGGCVVAVDLKAKRLRGLLGNLYRLGHRNVVTVAGDGRSLPTGTLFDRVLVDVPCSAEGNLRSRGGELTDQPDGFRERIAAVQEALLRRAVALTRPGGVVVYSTCTFAPEENEAVVARVLDDAPVTTEAVPLEAPHAPGLPSFEGVSFPDALREAWRVYPHHLDSGGLFMARLRKEGREEEASVGGDTPGWGPLPPVFPGRETPTEEARERIEAGIRRLREELAVPEDVTRSHGWIERGKSVWMHRCRAWPVPGWEEHPGDRRILAVGLRALTEDSRYGERPDNDLLRALDGSIRARVVDLSPGEWLELLEAGELPAEGIAVVGRDGARPASGVADGFVALRLDGRVTGRGWLVKGRLKHEIPKARARRLLDVLGIREGRTTTG